MNDALHIRGMPDDTVCEVHDWPIERLRKEFLPLLRARHGKGGLNVCVPCVERLKAFVDTELAKKASGP